MKPAIVEAILLKMGETSPEPNYLKLYKILRLSIIDKSLKPNEQLPSSRTLANELKIARNTVVSAYNKLQSEGYLASCSGSGTFISENVHEERIENITPKLTGSEKLAHAKLSPRGLTIIETIPNFPSKWGSFMPGLPDVKLFPFKSFASGIIKNPTPEMLAYSSGGGSKNLREALSKHLKMSRAVLCDPEQIIITEGTHQAIDLTIRMLGSFGDIAWIEDPGYWGAKATCLANGMEAVHLPVDGEGMCIPPQNELKVPKFIFVTPSHQFPLGTVMSLSRRRELIQLAREHGSWIIEDDYDSEFRFAGAPIPALQGLEHDAPAIYIGTFSKTMFPSLRIGYMVVPKELAQSFKSAHATLYREGNSLMQEAVASFISSGKYMSHIQQMRKVYSRRRNMLTTLIQKRLPSSWLSMESEHAGLHLVLSLPNEFDDVKIADRAQHVEILTRPLSKYYSDNNNTNRKGLLLGFACAQDENIINDFEKLLNCIYKFD